MTVDICPLTGRSCPVFPEPVSNILHSPFRYSVKSLVGFRGLQSAPFLDIRSQFDVFKISYFDLFGQCSFT